MANGRSLESLPDEILLECLKYCDIPTLIKFSFISQRMRRLANDNSLWISACQKHPIAKALINALGIKIEKLSAKNFLSSIVSHNIDRLKFLLNGYANISLYFPTYESLQQLQNQNFLFKPYGDIHRQLFLSQEIAKQKILNITSVQGFITVALPIDQVDLAKLCKEGMIPYDGTIKKKSYCQLYK